jgi:hypothetical protein
MKQARVSRRCLLHNITAEQVSFPVEGVDGVSVSMLSVRFG